MNKWNVKRIFLVKQMVQRTPSTLHVMLTLLERFLEKNMNGPENDPKTLKTEGYNTRFRTFSEPENQRL